MTEPSVEHGTIVVERRFQASPQQVFAAWADPGARRRWDVPRRDWEYVQHAHDFGVGGRDIVEFGPPGQLVFRAVTQYENIVDERRIVSTYTIANAEVLLSVSVLTVELRPDDGGTHMIVTEQGAFLDGTDSPAARRHGLDDMLDQLEAQLLQ